MSAKHTPAPWLAAGKHITQDDGGVIAYTTAYAKPTPRQLADARLIAAAPELLAVAEFFLRGIEGGHIRCAPYIDFDPNAATLEIKSPAQRLRDAIAKATGENL